MCSVVISVFAIVILSIIGGMFASNNHTVMGSDEDPADGGKVAAAVFGAVVVYAVCGITEGQGTAFRKYTDANIQIFLIFCGLQAFLHKRQSRNGEIALR